MIKLHVQMYYELEACDRSMAPCVCVVRDSNIFDVFQAYFEQAHQLVINENILLQTLGKSQQKCCPRPYSVSTTECQMRTQDDFCLM